MTAPNALVAILREWIGKAENDLTTAVHTLTLGKECPTDTICFHAQQCVEKYIKALLTFRSIPFPKTHDIKALRTLLPPKLRPKLDRKTQMRLTDYAVTLRYPGLEPPIPLAEARSAVAAARQVRKEVRRNLPLAARRRARK
jgi:HEPN domain-containing protein